MASTIVTLINGKAAKIVFVRERRKKRFAWHQIIAVLESFFTCCEKLVDISWLEALHRIMTLAIEQLCQIRTFCEKTGTAFFEAAIAAALKHVNL